ncbi:MAG TPA: hypothetical protein VGG46_12645 [Terriglobales bacterium]|jgi:hypothetical protein
MDKDEAFRIWSPPQLRWSRWVKPVLFAFMDGVFGRAADRSTKIDLGWLPQDGSAAIIVNLPNEDGVFWGIQLAHKGYQPVPVYNALPFPLNAKASPRSRPVSTVAVEPILAALYEASSALEQIKISDNAPPAFLLDADRGIARADEVPGVFDNRSVCFITDFPSAELLFENGIRSAIVVQRETEVARDLSRVLLSWQEIGIQLFRREPYEKAASTPIKVAKPSFLRSLLDRLQIIFGLRRGELGAFGGVLRASGG